MYTNRNYKHIMQHIHSFHNAIIIANNNSVNYLTKVRNYTFHAQGNQNDEC